MRITNTARLGLDVGLFVALLVAFFPGGTGISVHEWLSLAIIVPTLFHLIINWDWVVRSVTRLFGKLRAVSRVNLIVDAVLFVASVTVMLSGFMVSQTIANALGIVIVPSVTWHVVHSMSADIVIGVMLVHLGLHWRWVVRVVDCLLGGTVSREIPATIPIRTHSASPRTEEPCPPEYYPTP